MRFMKYGVGFILGAIGGFSYYYFIGCKTGTCPLTGNPYISTVWGGVLGALIADTVGDLFRKKKTT